MCCALSLASALAVCGLLPLVRDQKMKASKLIGRLPFKLLHRYFQLLFIIIIICFLFFFVL